MTAFYMINKVSGMYVDEKTEAYKKGRISDLKNLWSFLPSPYTGLHSNLDILRKLLVRCD